MMLVDAAVQTSLYSPVSPLSLLCLSSVSPLSLLYRSPLFQVQAKLENVKRYGQGGGVTRMSIDDSKPSYNGINLSTARTTTPQPSLHSSQPSQPLLTTPRKKPETLSTAPLNQQNNTVVATALLERSIPAGANLIPMDNAEMQGMLLLLVVMMMLMLLMLLMLLPLVATGCHWLPLVVLLLLLQLLVGTDQLVLTLHPLPFQASKSVRSSPSGKETGKRKEPSPALAV